MGAGRGSRRARAGGLLAATGALLLGGRAALAAVSITGNTFEIGSHIEIVSGDAPAAEYTPDMTAVSYELGDTTLALITVGATSPMSPASTDAPETAYIVVAGNRTLMVDAGYGAFSRIRAFNPAPGINQNLTDIVLTHFHKDHYSDLAKYAQGTYLGGRDFQLNIHGPYTADNQLGTFVDGINAVIKGDFDRRVAHHEGSYVDADGNNLQYDNVKCVAKTYNVKMKDSGTDVDNEFVTLLDEAVNGAGDKLKVTLFETFHDPAGPIFGLNVEAFGRKVVLSGDTDTLLGADGKVPSYFAPLKDADVMVLDVLDDAGVDAGVFNLYLGIMQHIDLQKFPAYMGDINTAIGNAVGAALGAAVTEAADGGTTDSINTAKTNAFFNQFDTKYAPSSEVWQATAGTVTAIESLTNDDVPTQIQGLAPLLAPPFFSLQLLSETNDLSILKGTRAAFDANAAMLKRRAQMFLDTKSYHANTSEVRDMIDEFKPKVPFLTHHTPGYGVLINKAKSAAMPPLIPSLLGVVYDGATQLKMGTFTEDVQDIKPLMALVQAMVPYLTNGLTVDDQYYLSRVGGPNLQNMKSGTYITLPKAAGGSKPVVINEVTYVPV